MRLFVKPDSLMSKILARSKLLLNQFCILLLLAMIIYGAIVCLVAEIALIIVLDFRFAGLSKNIYEKPISFAIN